MTKAKTLETSKRKRKQERIVIKNDEMTLLEFHNLHFENGIVERLFITLQEFHLLDKYGVPSEFAISKQILYQKDETPNPMLTSNFAPNGKRIIVGQPDWLYYFLKLNSGIENMKSIAMDYQQWLLTNVFYSPF